MPLPPGMNFAYWCLSLTILVESSTLSGAMFLFTFYRNLGTSLKFFIISHSARTWTLAEQSIFFICMWENLPNMANLWAREGERKKRHQQTKEHISHVNWKKNTKINVTTKDPLPENSCYFYMNHSFLIIHVLAQGYGERGKAWFSLLEWLFFGVQKKQINVVLDLSTLPETESRAALLVLCHCFQWWCQFIYWREKPLCYLLLVPWPLLGFGSINIFLQAGTTTQLLVSTK